MPPSNFGSVFGSDSGCPSGSLREARRSENNAIIELGIQRVQAVAAGNGDWLADIDSQIAQHEAQLAAWVHCVDDDMEGARGPHFRQ